MRRHPSLVVLARGVNRRSLLLRSLVDNLSPPVKPEDARTVVYVTIEALNLWSNFCRSFYLSCCFNAKTSGGHSVVISGPVINSHLDAIQFAVSVTGRSRRRSGPWSRRDEPAWHVPRIFLTVLTRLGMSNWTTVQAALSYPMGAFDDLRAVRNFFAHRNEETVAEVVQVARNHALSPNLRPTDLVCSSVPSRPQALMADWLDDIRSVAGALCA